MKKLLAAVLVAAIVVGLVPPEAGAVARTDGGRLWTPGSGPTLLSLPEAGLPATKTDLLKERGAGDHDCCTWVYERKKYGFDPDTQEGHWDCPYTPCNSSNTGGGTKTDVSGSNSGNTAILILLGVLLVVVAIAAVAASKKKPKNDDWMRR